MKFNIVVCGGTFDHFHRGHSEFLHHGLSISNKLLVGLTTDKYVKERNKGEWIQDYQIRKQQLEQFLRKKKVRNRVSIAPIDDIFIPKVWESLEIEAIIVSKDSILGAKSINLRRKEQGKSTLKTEVFPLIKSEDVGYISSSRIRNGEINREGKLYAKDLWFNKDLKLPENLRGEFQKPFGELFKDINDSFKNKKSLVITVGDITSKIFNEKSLGQNMSVIDFKVAREKKFSNIEDIGFNGNENILKVNNPAGHITSSLFQKLSEVLKSNILEKTILEINGEEDLAVLPLVLLSPLNTLIYYGQPSKGVVKIMVSEESKDKAYNLISKLKLV